VLVRSGRMLGDTAAEEEGNWAASSSSRVNWRGGGVISDFAHETTPDHAKTRRKKGISHRLNKGVKPYEPWCNFSKGGFPPAAKKN